MTDLDLRRLRYFVCVAEASSFRAAADQLRIAQPSLSRQVRALELDLHVKLFHRTPHGAHLTSEGQELLEAAREILQRSQLLIDRRRHDDPASAVR